MQHCFCVGTVRYGTVSYTTIGTTFVHMGQWRAQDFEEGGGTLGPAVGILVDISWANQSETKLFTFTREK